MSLQSEQTPILNAIGSALIAATPEHWKSVTLELVATQPTTLTVGLVHTITSPEGHRDLITPTEDLMAATTELQCLCERYGRPFARIVFEVSCDANGSWNFASDLSY